MGVTASMGESIQFQGACPNCGTVTYIDSREHLRDALASGAVITLLCTNCKNGSRPALPVERQRLAKIIDR